VGLISYVALVCNPRPRRMTVYISSEAYKAAPPRSLHAPRLAAQAASCRGVVRKRTATIPRAGSWTGI
ncbi:MAG: hypothetical protein JWM17_1927, partial [Actinobacteria bacterium]|nr:hypothetical protein [Actinomycetota bacterium]